jgi:hypothetical protein
LQFLCIFPWIGAAVSWLAIVIAIVLSGLVVSLNMFDALREVPERAMIAPFVGVIVACHIGLGMALKFYFFHHIQHHSSASTLATTLATTTAAILPSSS